MQETKYLEDGISDWPVFRDGDIEWSSLEHRRFLLAFDLDVRCGKVTLLGHIVVTNLYVEL